jgi:hypothetical protein
VVHSDNLAHSPRTSRVVVFVFEKAEETCFVWKETDVTETNSKQRKKARCTILFQWHVIGGHSSRNKIPGIPFA